MTDETAAPADDDLRSTLEAAYEAQVTPAEAEPSPAPEAAPEPVEAAPEAPEAARETTAEKEARERDEKGRFAKKSTDPIKVEAPKPEAKASPPAAPVEPEVKPPVQADVRAPQSWKPAVREKFAGLPPEVQQEVVRVDREVMRTMQESAEARQFHQRFQQGVAPYESIFRGLGISSEQAIGTSLQTLAQLASGPPAVKAKVAAEIIKNYGIDIQMLDSELAGQAPPPGQAQPAIDPNQIIRQAREAMRAEMQQAQNSQFETKMRAEIESMKTLEFFDDVREDMANIIEGHAKRGVVMTPRDAYNLAVWANPSTAEVMQQRQAAKVAANPQGSTQRARAAASSVRGTPAAPPNGAQSDDLRSVLEASWEKLQNSR